MAAEAQVAEVERALEWVPGRERAYLQQVAETAVDHSVLVLVRPWHRVISRCRAVGCLGAFDRRYRHAHTGPQPKRRMSYKNHC